MREIAYTVSYTYPAMFQWTELILLHNLNFAEFEEGDDGCLAPEKVDELASNMKDRVGLYYVLYWF